MFLKIITSLCYLEIEYEMQTEDDQDSPLPMTSCTDWTQFAPSAEV